MSLVGFSVSRFRSFRAPASLTIAPLTLVYGPNNVGKSSLLRALRLFASSVGGSVSAGLNLACEAARGATYHDLRSRHDATNELGFSLEWDDDVDRAVIDLRFMEEPDGGHLLKELEYRNTKGNSFEFRISVDTAGYYELVREGRVIAEGPLGFQGVRPVEFGAFGPEVEAMLTRVADILDALRASVLWLTAVRAAVPRRRVIPAQEPVRVADGAWVQDRLARDVTHGRRDLIAAVSAEVEAMFGCVLHVDIDDGELLLRGSPIGAQWRFSLADMGEGITQALPVIVLGCLAERGELGAEPVLCIEQPEVQLHADAELALARFLRRVATCAKRPRLLLETHSEILLSALLLEVAEERLPAASLALHWVSRESPAGESVTQRVEVDVRGQVKAWPTGALSERSELARQLFTARRR